MPRRWRSPARTDLLNARLTADGHQDDESGNFKPELMQCVLEINTDVCETIGDAERDLRGKIAIVEAACDALGLRLWWGGDASVFARWDDQRITPDDRYLQLVESAARDGPAAGDVRPARPRRRRFGRQGGDDLRPHHAASADAARAQRQQPVLGRPQQPACIRTARR